MVTASFHGLFFVVESCFLRRERRRAFLPLFVGGRDLFLILCCVVLADILQPANANEPRIVNLYNFVRNSDYRVPNSEEVLNETTRQQIALIHHSTVPQLGLCSTTR